MHPRQSSFLALQTRVDVIFTRKVIYVYIWYWWGELGDSVQLTSTLEWDQLKVGEQTNRKEMLKLLKQQKKKLLNSVFLLTNKGFKLFNLAKWIGNVITRQKNFHRKKILCNKTQNKTAKHNFLPGKGGRRKKNKTTQPKKPHKQKTTNW